MANALVAIGQGSPDNAANYPYTFQAADVNDMVSTPSTGASAAPPVATDTVSRNSVIEPHATVGRTAGHVLLLHEVQLPPRLLSVKRWLSVIRLLPISASARFLTLSSQTVIKEAPACCDLTAGICLMQVADLQPEATSNKTTSNQTSTPPVVRAAAVRLAVPQVQAAATCSASPNTSTIVTGSGSWAVVGELGLRSTMVLSIPAV